MKSKLDRITVTEGSVKAGRNFLARFTRQQIAESLSEIGPVSKSIFDIAFPEQKFLDDINDLFKEKYISSEEYLKFKDSCRKNRINKIINVPAYFSNCTQAARFDENKPPFFLGKKIIS